MEELQTIISTERFNNDFLYNYIYSISDTLELEPKREHRIAEIEYTDIKRRDEDFINALIDTIVSWVYSNKEKKRIFEEKQKEFGDIGAASSFLYKHASRKFRKGRPQGQFGEILLFNFLEKFYNAVPLVRKMPITTSSSMERFGADAIHIGQNDNNQIVLYLGEAKCYKSEYSFNAAIKDAVESIFKTFNYLNSELDLYVYDDFISEKLLPYAKAYKRNELDNVRFELVCIVIYNETNEIKASDEIAIKQEIVNIVKQRCHNLDKTFYQTLEKNILSRLHYILFPIHNLDELLDNYSREL